MTSNPALSPWCQRWSEHQPRWTHPNGARFSPARYGVAPLADVAARAFCTRHHYAGSAYPAALRRYGLTDRDTGQLVGVAVIAAPVAARVLTGPFPTLEPYRQGAELARFVLSDDVPANGESWMLAQVFRHLRDDGFRGIVSFADPLPRAGADGTLNKPGHIGLIYQATNALYTGQATPRTLTVLPDGTILNDRTAQKIRSQHVGHHYAEQRLLEHGAPPRQPSQPAQDWLRDALTVIGARRVRHPGNHRYLFRLGSSREQRSIILGHPTSPYPKPRPSLF